MIVIDVGCARYGGDYSIERLIEEFHPDVLYGFDPNAALGAIDLHGPSYPLSTGQSLYEVDGTTVVLQQSAAWTHDGHVPYREEGLNSCLASSGPEVVCFDLAAFIKRLPEGEEIVLKLDAEGSEYELLEHLVATEADTRLQLAWVEWHGLAGASVQKMRKRRERIEAALRCPVEEWRW